MYMSLLSDNMEDLERQKAEIWADALVERLYELFAEFR